MGLLINTMPLTTGDFFASMKSLFEKFIALFDKNLKP